MRIFITTILLLVVTSFYAQSPKQKIVDRVSSAYSIKQSVVINNNVYSVGENETPSSYYPCLLKQDLELNYEYITRVLRPSVNFDSIEMNQMIVTSDQHLILAGWTGSQSDAPMWVFKMDTMLNIIWEKDVKTAGFQVPYDLFLNNVGGCTVLGSETIGGVGGINTIQVVNFDVNGDTLWTRKVGTTIGVQSRYPVGFWDPNGDLVVRIRNGYDSELIKFDEFGNYISYTEYVEASGMRMHIYNMQNYGQDTYMVGNMNGGNPMLLKVDNIGNVIWCNSYPELWGAYSLEITTQDEILISCGSVVMKTDLNGVPIKAKNYGKSPNSHAFYSDILEVNNHFFVAGRRQYQANKTGYQLTLDGDLNSGSCYEKEMAVTSIPLSVSLIPLAEPIHGSLQSDILFYGPNTNEGWFLNAGASTYNLDNTIVPTIDVLGDDCGGTCNGSATASAIGGDPTYVFEWSDGQVGSEAFGLCSGNQVVLSTGDQFGCYVSDTIIVPETTPITDVCMVTVDSTSTKNEVVWEKPISGAIEGFKIYRDIAGNYGLVGYVPYDSLSKFIDNTNGVNPNVTSYRYKISTIDTCGNESELSDYHETIHVTVNQGGGTTVNLIWDSYEGFPYSYNRILRDSIGDGNWRAVDSVANTVFTWTDNNSPTDSTGYMIEVITPYTCTSTKSQDHNTTRSNRHTIAGPSSYTSLEELILSQASVFPNPNNGLFTVNVKSDNWSYSLFDMSGKLISMENVSETTKQIDIQTLETGIYLMKIELGGSSVYKKVIKQ